MGVTEAEAQSLLDGKMAMIQNPVVGAVPLRLDSSQRLVLDDSWIRDNIVTVDIAASNKFSINPGAGGSGSPLRFWKGASVTLQEALRKLASPEFFDKVKSVGPGFNPGVLGSASSLKNSPDLNGSHRIGIALDLRLEANSYATMKDPPAWLRELITIFVGLGFQVQTFPDMLHFEIVKAEAKDK